MDLEVRVENPAPLQTVFHVSYPESLKARNGTVVRVKGFMYPLEAGETHTYFLLSALPPSCPFCLPASARGLVEVKYDEGGRYTLEPVLLEGRFELLEGAATGLYYRLEKPALRADHLPCVARPEARRSVAVPTCRNDHQDWRKAFAGNAFQRMSGSVFPASGVCHIL